MKLVVEINLDVPQTNTLEKIVSVFKELERSVRFAVPTMDIELTRPPELKDRDVAFVLRSQNEEGDDVCSVYTSKEELLLPDLVLKESNKLFSVGDSEVRSVDLNE